MQQRRIGETQGLKAGFCLMIALCLLIVSWPRSLNADLAIRNATVVDVIHGSLLTDQTVLIRGSKIVAVGPMEALSVPANTELLEAEGRFLIPGLWDMHVHSIASYESSPAVANQDWHLPLFLAHGVTGVRNMNDFTGDVTLGLSRKIRKELAEGRRLGPPHFLTAGPSIDGDPYLGSTKVVVRSAAEARVAVEQLALNGADLVKIYENLSREAYFAALDAAHIRGIPVDGHLPFRISAREAAEAGQRTIEHPDALAALCSAEAAALRERFAAVLAEFDSLSESERFLAQFQHYRALYDTRDPSVCMPALEVLRQYGVAVTADLVAYHHVVHADQILADDSRMRLVPDAIRADWEAQAGSDVMAEFQSILRTIPPLELANTGLANEAGVVLLAATDAGVPFQVPGFDLHVELERLVEAGLTPLEALRSATINPARVLDRADTLGSVEAGRLADLVLLEANPLEDIRNSKRIHAVIADGRLYRRRDLDRILAEVQALDIPRTHGFTSLPGSPFPFVRPEAVGLAGEKLEWLGDEIVSWIAAGELVGAELLVIKDGRTVFHEAYGWSDREQQIPVERNSIWWIGGVSKAYFATAILMLAEEGKLSINDPLSKYFPEIAEEDATTIRHLLTHTSGFTERAGPGGEEDDFSSLEAWVRDWAAEGPRGAVGAFYNSDFNFAALGWIVGQVSGTPIDRFLGEKIIEPLQLEDTSTGVSSSPQWRSRLNPWYRWNENANAFDLSTGSDFPGFEYYYDGLFSTAMDVAKFLAMWLGNGEWNDQPLISAQSVSEALTMQVRDDELYGYGYGWYLHQASEIGGPPWDFHHWGKVGAQAIAFPGDSAIVVYLTHSRGGPHHNAFWNRLGMSGLFNSDPGHDFGLADEVQKAQRTLTPEQRAPYIGSYAASEARDAMFEALEVWEEDGHLQLRAGAKGVVAGYRAHLVPLGNHRFAMGRYSGGALQGVDPVFQVLFVVDGAKAKALDVLEGEGLYVSTSRLD